MIESSRGMEAQLEQTKEQELPEDIKQLLEHHHEVLVIAVNPDLDSESEFKIASFTKMLDEKSILAPFLADLLSNLLKSNNDKQLGGVSSKTPINA